MDPTQPFRKMLHPFSASYNTRKDVQEKMMDFQVLTPDEWKEAQDDILSIIEVAANNAEGEGETNQFKKFEATQMDCDITDVQQHNISVQHETSSFINMDEVIGRDDEREKIVSLLTDYTYKEGVGVLPLIGVGGIGKTTLAQLVYNDQRVKTHFHELLWVHVSEHFDIKRLTKEIIELITREYEIFLPFKRERIPVTTNLDLLQQTLKKQIQSRSFLLVLDDVWNEDIDKWKSFIAPLKFALESKIIVTTRSRNVANMVGTIGPLYVYRLPDDACIELFMRSLFGSKHLSNYKLDGITRNKIVSLIKGSPLVAKELGRFLISEREYAKSTALSNNITASIPSETHDVLKTLESTDPHLKPIYSIGVGDSVMQYEIIKKDEVSFPDIEREMVGREAELERIVSILLNRSEKSASSNVGVCDSAGETSEGNYNITKRRKIENSDDPSNFIVIEYAIITIVGAGGLGKTALAKKVFNDPRVDGHFDLKFWVNIKSDFDLTFLHAEILRSVHAQIKDKISDSKSLQQMVKDMLASKRFLLVLDNVWWEDSSLGEHLQNLLSFGGVGSMIMASTRSLNVATLIGTLDPISLDILPDDIYWDYFKRRAFGHGRMKGDNQLEGIAKAIARKLGGIPLGAKVIGGLLNSEIDATHWQNVLNNLTQASELQEEEVNLYLPLKLSYEYMPIHLRQCFTFCSLFPKNHEFSEESLINMWVAQGFILPKGNKKLDATASEYLHDLVCRSFLQKSETKPAHFVIDDMSHDFAQFMSSHEIFKIQDARFKIPPTVKHLLICSNNPVRELLKELDQFRNILSLVILLTSVLLLDTIIPNLFERLKFLRYLKFGNCEIKNLPDNIGKLSELRYLDISWTKVMVLPESTCNLLNLEILDMRGCPIQNLPNRFQMLTNLRKLYMEHKLFSMINEVGKLTRLETLPQYAVKKKPGHGTEQLETLEDLTGTLALQNLDLVYREIGAYKAKLHEKKYINKLILEWSDKRKTNFGYHNFDVDEDVLEGLRPHSNIKELQIKHYLGKRSPSWLDVHIFGSLSSLLFKDCHNLRVIPQLPPSLSSIELINVGLYSLPKLWDGGEGAAYKNIRRSNLFVLHIERCRNLVSLENWLLPDYLPLLESIYIAYCEDLVSIPVERINGFSSLENLEIVACPNLIISTKRLTLSSSIKKLRLSLCGDLDRSLPHPLHTLKFLATLVIIGCSHVTSLPDEVTQNLKSLRHLAIESCKELATIEIQSIQSIKWFYVSQCKKLIDETYSVLEIEVTKKNKKYLELQEKSKINLETLSIDHTILTHLRGLQYPPYYLRKLVIQNSSEVKMFTGHSKRWLSNLKLLKEIWFMNCVELEQLPVEIYKLTSLEQIHLHDCLELETQADSLLPLNIQNLCVVRCPKFERGKKGKQVYNNLKASS